MIELENGFCMSVIQNMGDIDYVGVDPSVNKNADVCRRGFIIGDEKIDDGKYSKTYIIDYDTVEKNVSTLDMQVAAELSQTFTNETNWYKCKRARNVREFIPVSAAKNYDKLNHAMWMKLIECVNLYINTYEHYKFQEISYFQINSEGKISTLPIALLYKNNQIAATKIRKWIDEKINSGILSKISGYWYQLCYASLYKVLKFHDLEDIKIKRYPFQSQCEYLYLHLGLYKIRKRYRKFKNKVKEISKC